MSNLADHDRKSWNHIEELFKFRELLKKDISDGNTYLDTVKMEEVESNIYERLDGPVRSIILGLTRGRIQEDSVKGLTNEAILRIFTAYAGFKGRSSLKVFFASIVRNLTIDHLKKMSKERKLLVFDEENLRISSDEMALAAFNEEEKKDRQEAIAPSFSDIFEIIDLSEQKLTDKEFVAVILKLASARMKRKLTDEELARQLGIKRSAFLDSFKRGRDKICSHWKAKLKK